ncbi:MAG: dihydroorotate dehydrogenase electron transfer subunit [Flexistipes sinusarabici]|uniref:Dihydroorotate dehydrogenase electron transfer subunit n=1 Tax=Flexistipes sinusarabici TaxID=2352 RepID=A0A5D0MXW4_FLESI|nr:dihydroorotate dehydrogenase electron transfer subunit [Flexistipes sinusarabici]TYB36983.1 MAG: dihydroorotate dehydrogenase electron transfer subunit [Flexistipes sinusarabici]
MKGVVVDNRLLNDKYGLMCIESYEFVKNAKPGQFLMIKTQLHDYLYDPLLRRPLGICDVNLKRGTFSLLYMIVGKGTKLLSTIEKDTSISFSEPLGAPFNLTVDKRVAVIGGGVGIAPMIFLTKTLYENNSVDVFYGGAEEKDILLTYVFEKYSNNMKISTNDGSVGKKGFVTDLVDNIDSYDKVYACGPKSMLKAVFEQVKDRNNIEFEVSLEERMACGVGACLGCIIYIDDEKTGRMKQVRCCAEGPVFDGKQIIWDTVCKEQL